MALHEDEIDIDAALVRALIGASAPEFADLELRPLDVSGSSNALFRLGADLVVRLPRQPGGSHTIAKEAQWLPTLAPALPVAVPELMVVGEPGFGYPERWAIVRWIDGETPGVPRAGVQRAELARDLATLVTTLAAIPVPSAALTDPRLRSYRADPLVAMDAATRRYLDACRDLELDLDLDACARVWEAAMALPAAAALGTPRWLHGDLLAENLLVRDGRLAAVLDFGGLAVGDPTVDLIVAWEVLDAADRDTFRRALDVDELTWLRGRAWALAIALMTFPYYGHTMPGRCADRLAMARAVLNDFR